jgi:hypothetical protein
MQPEVIQAWNFLCPLVAQISAALLGSGRGHKLGAAARHSGPALGASSFGCLAFHPATRGVMRDIWAAAAQISPAMCGRSIQGHPCGGPLSYEPSRKNRRESKTGRLTHTSHRALPSLTSILFWASISPKARRDARSWAAAYVNNRMCSGAPVF